MVDQIIGSITSFLAKMDYDSIPDHVKVVVRQHLVDSLGCALGAPGAAFIKRMGPTVLGASSQRGVVIGTDIEVGEDGAAFINTALIRYLDFNDTYPGGHPSDCLGALLALCGRDVSGKRLLTATVATYEVYTRLSDAARFRYRGWDQGSAVALAVVAGIASLRGTGTAELEQAVAMAAVSCVPMRSTRAGQLSEWKGLATAYAARDAVFLAGLAERGVTGPESPFEGRHGMFDLITGPFTLEPFPTEGGRYLTPGARLKFWPVEYNIQLPVWAALELSARLEASGQTAQEIESVLLLTYWSAWHETASEEAKWKPTTRETADHSMPYLFARALLDGDITLHSLESAAYLDPVCTELAAKISVEVDDVIEAAFPAELGIVVRATMSTGATIEFELHNPRGHELNRMTIHETRSKFEAMAREAGLRDAQAALSFWETFDQHETLEAGFASLSGVRDS